VKPAALIVGIALIVAGIAFGGWWRWASAVVTGLGIVAIAVPGFSKGKHDNGNGELK
jgi:hypothetical protein